MTGFITGAASVLDRLARAVCALACVVLTFFMWAGAGTGRYVTLTQAMNSHDLGRDRGGADAVLAELTMPTLVVSIDTDTLFPPATQHRIARFAPGSITGDEALEIASPFGHDGFLLEMRAVGDALRRLLAA